LLKSLRLILLQNKPEIFDEYATSFLRLIVGRWDPCLGANIASPIDDPINDELE